MLSRIIHNIQLDGFVADSIVFVALHAMVLVAIIVDLASGWHKAKRLGQARTSKALRRTISKINSYYSCLLLLSMADVVLYMINIWERVGIPELPYFAGVGTVLILFIELRSVYENRSFNDPQTPDGDEVILSDQIKAGSAALDEIMKWAADKKAKLEELKGKEGES
nr:phage holin family protein [uncultured Porphyromonas sp.]